MISMALALVLVATAPGPADIKARAEAVVTIDRNQLGDPDQMGAAIRESFRLIEERELKPRLLKTYDTRTLEILFEAVAIASELIKQPKLLGVLEDIFQECVNQRQGNHRIQHFLPMLATCCKLVYILVRHFLQYSNLQYQHKSPDLP